MFVESNLSIVKDQFKELPNNIEAEQAVIGSLLVNNEIFDEISTIISVSYTHLTLPTILLV